MKCFNSFLRLIRFMIRRAQIMPESKIRSFKFQCLLIGINCFEQSAESAIGIAQVIPCCRKFRLERYCHIIIIYGFVKLLMMTQHDAGIEPVRCIERIFINTLLIECKRIIIIVLLIITIGKFGGSVQAAFFRFLQIFQKCYCFINTIHAPQQQRLAIQCFLIVGVSAQNFFIYIPCAFIFAALGKHIRSMQLYVIIGWVKRHCTVK